MSQGVRILSLKKPCQVEKFDPVHPQPKTFRSPNQREIPSRKETMLGRTVPTLHFSGTPTTESSPHQSVKGSKDVYDPTRQPRFFFLYITGFYSLLYYTNSL